MRLIRTAISAFLAASALTPLAATQAFAQAAEADSKSAGQIEEIVVTAQKFEQNVQNVPISISAISSAELQNRSVANISDIQSATPNVTFTAPSQGTMASTVGIRGLRSASIELTNDQPTAIYIDDVYQSSAIGSMAFLGPDVERIEVLRGPQGTLFGRNTVGGAVSIHTKRPDTSAFAGRVMAGAGNYGLVEGQAMLNVPLATDQLALRLNFGYHDDNGYARDRTYNLRLGQSKQVFVRGQLRINPTDDLDILLSADYVDSRTDGNLVQPVFLTPNSFAYKELGTFYGIDPFGLNPTAANYAAVQARFFSCGGGPKPTLADRCFSRSPTNPNVSTGLFAPNGSLGDRSTYKDRGVTANITYHLSDTWELKSITALRRFNANSPKDYDGADAIVLSSRSIWSGETLTQEGQLNGRLLDEKLKMTLGAYYYRFRGNETGVNINLVSLAGNNAANYLTDSIRNHSLGFFGQATYALTDRLNVTGGLRYTKEQKNVAVTQFSSRATTPACTLPFPNAQCLNTASLNYKSWDWTGGVDYSPTDDVMVYFRAAKGFQAGGINQRSALGIPFQTYRPMTAINYELGVKADLLDRHLRINVSAFQNDVKGLQLPLPRTFVGADGNPVTVVGLINAASARLRGVEAELTVIPFRNAQIAAQLGYTDPKYKKFIAIDSRTDLTQNDFQQISKFTFGISPSYTLPVSFGEIHFQADYVYQSRINLQPALTFPTDRELPVPAMIQKGYGLLNGRIAIRIGDQTEIALWGKNLTDKRYFNSGLNIANSLGIANAVVGTPRTVGAQVSQKF